MGGEIAKLLAAAAFAAEAHRRQCRKDAAQSPYINHPIAVAHILAQSGEVEDADLLAAALLHDTVEDTETTLDEVGERFGAKVRSWVAEVTDDPGLSREHRKAKQVEHAPHLSEGAKLLKIADKISNLRDLGPDSPVGWTLQRKQQYVAWGEQVVAGCRGVHRPLEQLFDQTVQQVRARLADSDSYAPGESGEA